MQEWPGFTHDWPMPLTKHFDLIKGLMTGTRILLAGVIVGRAHEGNETEDQAQIAALWLSKVTLTLVQSGLMFNAQAM